MGGITVENAQVLKVEHRAGNFTNGAGEKIEYDFHLATLFCGGDVIEVKFKPDRPDARPPKAGDTITLAVELPKGTKPVATAYVPASTGAKAS